MNVKHTFLALASLCLAHSAQASVTIQTYVGALKDLNGANIPANTTMILVADTNGFSDMAALAQELSGKTLTSGTTIGSGGKILQVIAGTSLGGSEYGYANSFTGDLAALGLTGSSNNATATDLAIIWFPGLTGAGGQTLADGQSFGFYRSDTVDPASYGGNVPANAISFNVPPDGFDYDISAVASGGGIQAGSFNAAYTVTGVPEPSRLAFIFLGLAGVISRRKRK